MSKKSQQSLSGSRNLSIDGLRGIMALGIAAFHFDAHYNYPYLATFYLAVEFFFILSGFLLMKHFTSNPEVKINVTATPLKILLSRLKQFFLLNFICVAVLHTWYFFVGNSKTLAEFCNTFFDRIGEILFLQCSGLSIKMINLPAWYLSALLIASYFIIVLLWWNRRAFECFIAPLAIMMIYANISQTAGKLDVWWTMACGLINYGLLRGFAGLCVGCLLYTLYDWINQHKVIDVVVHSRMKIAFYIVDLLNFAIMFKLLIKREPSQNDFLIIVCYCIAILFSFWRLGLVAKIVEIKPIVFFGKISLALYLCHWFIIEVVNKYFSQLLYGPKMFVFLCVSTLYAVVLTYVVEPLLKKAIFSLYNVIKKPLNPFKSKN